SRGSRVPYELRKPHPIMGLQFRTTKTPIHDPFGCTNSWIRSVTPTAGGGSSRYLIARLRCDVFCGEDRKPSRSIPPAQAAGDVECRSATLEDATPCRTTRAAQRTGIR